MLQSNRLEDLFDKAGSPARRNPLGDAASLDFLGQVSAFKEYAAERKPGLAMDSFRREAFAEI